jgi:hypothetical protein
MTTNFNDGKLTLSALAEAKQLPATWLHEELGVRELPGGGVGIPYYDFDGSELAVKSRTALKATDGSFWPKGRSLAAYGSWRIETAQKAGHAYIAEGETDCWTLWRHGLPAVGIPGANAVKNTLLAEHVVGLTAIYVVREPDRGGDAFIVGVAARLAELGFDGKLYELRMPEGIKDPSELHLRDPEEFKEVLQAAVESATMVPLARPGRRHEQESAGDPEPWLAPVPLATVPAVEPFPLDTFPANLREYVERASTALACPPDYCAVPMIALAGGALGASRAIEIKPGWNERPSIYAAVIGRPGSAKSPALKAVASPFYAEQARLKVQWDKAREVYGQELEEYDRSKKRGDGEDDSEPPEKPKPPILQRLYASDTTVEALAPVLLANQHGLVIIRDELMAWVAAMNAYRAGKGADRQFYLSGWAGEPLCVDRKLQNGVPIIVPHPFLCVVGGLPPDLVGQFRDERNASDGFIDRLLFSYPDPGPVAGHNDHCIPEEAAAVWRDALTFLWKLNMVPNGDGTMRPRYVPMTADAREEWKKFYDDNAAEMNDEAFPEHLMGPWSKLRGYAGRLALVVHFLRVATGEAPDEDVDAESVRRAVKLVAYFKSHARKVYATMDLDEKVKDAKKVLKWMVRQRKEQFSKRDAHNALMGTFKTADDLEGPLGLLVRHGYIRPLAELAKKGPGRKPSPVYEVHPDTCSTELTQLTD